jgi:hypothetical protein
VRKRHERVIGLTSRRCAAAVGSGRLPVGGGSEAVAALPPRLGFRLGEGECARTNGRAAPVGPRGGVQLLARR